MTNQWRENFNRNLDEISKGAPENIHIQVSIIDDDDFVPCPQCGHEMTIAELKKDGICYSCIINA